MHRWFVGFALIGCSGGDDLVQPSIPEITILAPSADATVLEGEAVRVEIQVTDADNEPDELDLVWRGSADGQGPATPDADGTAAFDLVDVPVGPASVTVRVTDPDGLGASETVRFEVIARPVDADNDGYFDEDDCDDGDPEVNPGATEICDGIDNDCDDDVDEGLTQPSYRDADADGYGDPAVIEPYCDEPPVGYVLDDTDCNDAHDESYPDAPETCDGIDNDCDTEIDEGVQLLFFADRDGDGYGDPNNPTPDCTMPLGSVVNADDCDDRNPLINVNALSTTDPPDGAVGVYNEADIVAVLTNEDPQALVTVRDAGGAAWPGTVSVSGPTVTFAPATPFDAGASYTVEVTWQCGGDQTSFSAGDFVTPVDPALLPGTAYRFDLSSGDFVQPANLGGLIKPFIGGGGTEVLVGIEAEGASTLDLRVGKGAPGGQDVCAPTEDLPGVDFSANPALFFETGRLELDAQGIPLVAERLQLDGRLEQSLGTAIAEFEARLDTRDMSAALFGAPDQLCLLAPAFGATCTTCDDGQLLCLDTVLANVVGVAESLSLVPRTPGDIAADPGC